MVLQLNSLPDYPSYPGWLNFSYVSLKKRLKSLHARQGSQPTQGIRLDEITFYQANSWCRAIPANLGEINRENNDKHGGAR